MMIGSVVVLDACVLFPASLRDTLPRAAEIDIYTPKQQIVPLLEKMTNHPKDRHVLAAAVAAPASVLVTFNLTDFPAQSAQPYQVTVLSPDAFLTQLAQEDAATLLMVVQKQARALQHPPKSVDEVLATLAQHAPTFVKHMQAGDG